MRCVISEGGIAVTFITPGDLETHQIPIEAETRCKVEDQKSRVADIHLIISLLGVITLAQSARASIGILPVRIDHIPRGGIPYILHINLYDGKNNDFIPNEFLDRSSSAIR